MFTFAGVDVASRLADVGEFIVTGIKGRNAMSPEVKLTRSVGSAGSRFIETSFPPREITVGFALVGESALTQQEAEQRLAGLVSTRTPQVLAFADQSGVYEAILSDVSVSTAVDDYQAGGLTFTCPRPFLLGDDVSATVAGAVTGETNWFVEPVWTVKPTNAVSGFTLDVDGEEFVYAGALGALSTVVIDSAARETRFAGILKVAEVSGVYPTLTASSVVSLSVPGVVTVAYRARWI